MNFRPPSWQSDPGTGFLLFQRNLNVSSFHVLKNHLRIKLGPTYHPFLLKITIRENDKIIDVRHYTSFLNWLIVEFGLCFYACSAGSVTLTNRTRNFILETAVLIEFPKVIGEIEDNIFFDILGILRLLDWEALLPVHQQVHEKNRQKVGNWL